MENPELANTSTKLDKKKKSKLYSDKHGGSSDQEAFMNVDADVKPRRSFWKNLFRKAPKKTEVPEMVTDQNKNSMISSRLNAIFEEPKTPEEKEHVVEEIEEIKNTLKKINPSTPPTVLLSGLTTDSITSPIILQQTIEIIEPQVIQEPARDETLLDYLSDVSSTSVVSNKVPPDIQQQQQQQQQSLIITSSGGDPTLVKEAYSFEYSETSDDNEQEPEDLTPLEENKTQDKVKFDDKVEQKDADSNIVVRDLNNPFGEDDLTEAADELEEQSEEVVRVLSPEVVSSSSGSPVQQQVNNRFPSTEFDENWLKYSSSLESIEESEIWSEKLNSVGLSKSTTTTTPTREISEVDEVVRAAEFRRLDDFFKMIFRQTTEDQLNYSVAYDPIFASFNVQCYQQQQQQQPSEMSQETKQKVVRKRKMMSLLNDKMKMAEYLREIELEQQEKDNHAVNCEPATPQTSPQINTLANSNNENEILILLENTKEKLLKYLDKNNASFDPKVFSLYPENYLEIFNLITNNSNTNNNSNKIESPDETTSTFSLNSFSEDFLSSNTEKKQQQELISQESFKSAETTSTTTVDTTIETKIKQFQNVDREIENIFNELLVNISELKESCILHGVREELEPPITCKPLLEDVRIVEPILDEILDRVVEMSEFNGHFASPSFSFVKEFGTIYNVPGTINLNGTTAAIVQHQQQNTLERCLQKSEGLLTALREEIIEYNPVSYLSNTNDDFIDGAKIFPDLYQPDKDFVPRNLLHLILNHSNTNENPDDNNKVFKKQDKSNNEIIRSEAENLLQNIEEKINSSINYVTEIEKSKKFGPYYDRKPGESRLLLENKPPTKTEIPEITDSLQHIFFGENSGDILQSEFNLVDDQHSPKPGPSKNHKNSIDSVLSQLPSIPSADLYNMSADSSKNVLQTLVENRFSGLTGCSEQAEVPLDLISNDPLASASSESPRKAIELERKTPEINLHNFCAENLNEINKSIEENMKIFHEKMQKINKMNAKTIEMLSNSNFSTPEGSLSILSTITENLTETASKTSKVSQDRYPQYISNSKHSLNEPQNNVPDKDKTKEK